MIITTRLPCIIVLLATDGSGSTEPADTSTGEPTAECGNGVLEDFGPAPEECDDNNLDPDDGCSDTCALDRRVFVTSTLSLSDTALWWTNTAVPARRTC